MKIQTGPVTADILCWFEGNCLFSVCVCVRSSVTNDFVSIDNTVTPPRGVTQAIQGERITTTLC